MEKKYVCRCGKEFSCLQALGGHARWCAERKEETDESDRGQSAVVEEMRGSTNSPSNHSKEGNGNDSDSEASKTDGVMPESWWQFRCVSCHEMFPTTEAFRQHYLVEHIQTTSCVKIESTSADEDSVRVSENEQTGPTPFCKRCRARILSSSEEDEVIEVSSKKGKHTTAGNEPATSPNQGSSGGILPESLIALKRHSSGASVTSTKSADSVTKNASSRVEQANSGTNILDGQTKGNDGDHSTSVVSSSSTKATLDEKVVVNLLKDANALSKVYKVVILNFFNGRRVNPDPSKGPVQVIRLGEKLETLTSEDGSEKSVLRERFVKLNFETGGWEQILKTKPAQADQPSSST